MDADEKVNLAEALLRLEMASRSKLRQLNRLIEELDSKAEDRQPPAEDGATFRVQEMSHRGSSPVGPH